MKRIFVLCLALSVFLLSCDGFIIGALSTDKLITDIHFEGIESTLEINADTGEIIITVPYGTDVTALTPLITHTGESVSPGSGTEVDFSNSVTFTVTAEDDSFMDFVVTVNVDSAPLLSTTKTISSFSFNDLSITAMINQDLGTISATVPAGTSVDSLVPAIIHGGESLSPASGLAQDFSSSVTYTVTAEDGSTNEYVVTVTVEEPLSSTNSISSFDLSSLSVSSVIDEDEGTISLNVPPGTDITALVPTIVHNGESISPESGTAQNFDSLVAYTVTAEDGTENEYVVTVIVDSEAPIGSWETQSDGNTFELIFKDDGTYEVNINGTTGAYNISGDRITIQDDGVDQEIGVYSFAFDSTDLTFTLVSDGDTNRSELMINGWTSYVAPETFTISGTVSIPTDLTGKKWSVGLDTDTNGGNGMVQIATGTVSGTSFDYNLSNVPSGTYYLYTVIDAEESWGSEDSGPLGTSDYWAYHNMSINTPPQNPSLIVSADADVDLTAILYSGPDTGSSDNTINISGTVTLPESLTDKKWIVMVDSDPYMYNLAPAQANQVSGTVTGSSFDYSCDVEEGDYYLYVWIDAEGDWDDDALTMLSPNDYIAFYGNAITSSPNLDLSGTDQTIDLTAQLVSDFQSSDYSGTWTAPTYSITSTSSANGVTFTMTSEIEYTLILAKTDFEYLITNKTFMDGTLISTVIYKYKGSMLIDGHFFIFEADYMDQGMGTGYIAAPDPTYVGAGIWSVSGNDLTFTMPAEMGSLSTLTFPSSWTK